jgi:hypothetical protein
LKLAHFGPLPPEASPLAGWDAALVAELARHADVGVFVEGHTAVGLVPASVRVHDLATVHWRNALFAYDLAIYELADDVTADFSHDALCDWPGVVVLHGDDPQPLFARAPRLRRAVLEHSLALVVLTPSLRSRLSGSEPWTSLHVLESRPEPVFETIATELLAICTAALAGRRGLVEEVLETACAEMPSFVPGDVRAPWRTEVDELSSLGALSSGSRGSSAPALGRVNRKR